MPFSAPQITRNTLTAGLLAVTSAAGAVALPASANAATKPRLSKLEVVVNRCPIATFPIVTTWWKGSKPTGVTVLINGTATAMRQVGTGRLGAVWNANPAGLQAGSRTRVTVIAGTATGAWTKVTRTVRVGVIHQCQG